MSYVRKVWIVSQFVRTVFKQRNQTNGDMLWYLSSVILFLCSVLGFQELCDETHSWINEKDQALSTEDCGRDLSSVQVLQRRHQVLFRG